VAGGGGDRANDRPDRVDPEDRHAAAEDAGGEVVHQHLEPGAGPLGGEPVDPLEQVRCQRTDDHGAQQHRLLRGQHHSHGGHRADHGAALSVDDAPAGIADQDRQEDMDDRVDQRAQLGIRQPAGRDEQRGDQAPGDERRDVGHDHAGQERADALDVGPDAGSLDRWGVGRGHVTASFG
jgi:hypothetical protein